MQRGSNWGTHHRAPFRVVMGETGGKSRSRYHHACGCAVENGPETTDSPITDRYETGHGARRSDDSSRIRPGHDVLITWRGAASRAINTKGKTCPPLTDGASYSRPSIQRCDRQRWTLCCALSTDTPSRSANIATTGTGTALDTPLTTGSQPPRWGSSPKSSKRSSRTMPWPRIPTRSMAGVSFFSPAR